MKLGIIGAMQEEIALLTAQLEHSVTREIAGSAFYEGTLHQLPVVVVCSGVGKVNAALCVQILADLFQVTHIVNTGIAGSLDAQLDIGDIAVSTEAMYHDFLVGPFGYPRGQVPRMDVLAFPADPHLIALAQNACRSLQVPCQTGRIVSGDQFVCSDAVKQDIIDGCGGICVEMEGAAIAHAAYRNRIPFVILRAISDKANHTSELDYPTFETQAAHHCASITACLARELAAHREEEER